MNGFELTADQRIFVPEESAGSSRRARGNGPLPPDYEPLVAVRTDDRNLMTSWQPRLKALGIPTPDTRFVDVETTFGGSEPIAWESDEVREAIRTVGDGQTAAVINSVYYPHRWYDYDEYSVEEVSEDALDDALYGLAKEHIDTQISIKHGVAVREALPLVERSGPKPRRVRVFVDADVHYGFAVQYDDTEAQKIFSDDTPLTQLIDWSRRIAEEFEDPYSIDFLQTKDGDWYATRMQLDGACFHYTQSEWEDISYHPPLIEEYRPTVAGEHALPDGSIFRNPADVTDTIEQIGR